MLCLTTTSVWQQGIQRQAMEGLGEGVDLSEVPITLDHPTEDALARQLLKFSEVGRSMFMLAAPYSAGPHFPGACAPTI